MKLRKVESLCKKNKNITLYNQFTGPVDDEGVPAGVVHPDHLGEGQSITDPRCRTSPGRQWVGNGHFLYPIRGLPTLDEESLLSVFDVAKPEDFTVRLLDDGGFDLSDAAKGEAELEPAPFTLQADGATLWPMRCPGVFYEDALLFVNEAYLAPAEDEDEMRAFTLRKTATGTPYVAVKSGLILVGIVLPVLKLSDTCTAGLMGVAGLAVDAMERRKNREGNND